VSISQRILPVHLDEPGNVRVRGDDLDPVLDGQGGQVRVRDELAVGR